MRFVLPLIVGAILSASAAQAAGSLLGTVVAIADGDTVTVLDATKTQHKIRVAGIDAPEKAQPFGEKSKQHIAGIVFRREVEAVGDKRDRYGRRVAKIMVADPNCNLTACPKIHDAGLMQVMAGFAWHYKQYEREQSPEDRRAYAEAEERARDRRAGLWAEPKPIPPWDWRKAQRNN